MSQSKGLILKSKAPTVLLVGGPHDKQRVPVNTALKIYHHMGITYKRIQLEDSEDNVLLFYKYHNLTDIAALKLLMRGYT